MKKSDGDWWKKLPDNCALIRGSNAGGFIYCLVETASATLGVSD